MRKASSQRPGPHLHIWLQCHAQVLLASLGRMVRAPLSTLMTSAVIGIALAIMAATLYNRPKLIFGSS